MDEQLTVTPQHSRAKGGCSYAVMRGAAEYFGTRGLVTSGGTIDEVPFRSSSMGLGDGTHELPVAKALRAVMGIQVGHSMDVRLLERVGAQPEPGSSC